jgi:hypothetical protein
MVGNGGRMIDLGDILMRSPPLPTLHELKVYFINDLYEDVGSSRTEVQGLGKFLSVLGFENFLILG